MARFCLRKDHCICSLFQYCLSLFQYLPQHLPLATTSPFWKRCWRGQDLICCLQDLKYNMWLCTFLLANTDGLKPCSELPFGFGGCTGAAIPVFRTGAPCLHAFLHLLVITVDVPMDVVQVFADDDFLSSFPCFTSSSLMKMIKLIKHVIQFWSYYGFYLEDGLDGIQKSFST